MGVFGAIFGRRGDAGFNGCCSGERSGVVGFKSPRCRASCAKKFALLGLMVGVSAKKFAQRTKNGPKSAFCALLGEFFRGNATGEAVLGEFFRGRPAGGAVLGEFFRGPAVVGSHRANFVAPQPWPQALYWQC